MLYCQSIPKKGGISMTQDRFERETNYALAIAAAREMLKRGILNERDIRKIETIFLQKYRPILIVKHAG
jgi:hypothetical protein